MTTTTAPLAIGTAVQMHSSASWQRIHTAVTVDPTTVDPTTSPFPADIAELDLVPIRITGTVQVVGEVSLPLNPAEWHALTGAAAVPVGTVWWVARRRLTIAYPA